MTFTLLDNKGQFAKDNVQVSLRKDSETVASGSGWIDGKGQIQLNIPKELQQGDYELYVKSTSFQDKASVKVKKSLLTFLETDKPIYKPGQTIHIRVVTLNSDLLPIEETATVEVLGAKGIKIFRKEVTTDEYGMATVDLPLSSEPNLGQWKINAKAAGETTQLDVKVEEYVLPKYEVEVDLAKEWCLVNESIKGSVKAEYSFGKPVKGEIHISASRYVGEWEEYTTLTKAIDGETDFEISPVGYVAGVPQAQGMGNVMLDITVTEESTGYQEKTTRMLTVSESSLNIQAIPESSVFKPGLPFNFLIVTETPDNQPTESTVRVEIDYFNKEFERIKKAETSIKTTKGQGILSLTPPDDAVALQLEAFAGSAETTNSVEAGHSPSDNFIHVEQVSEGIPQVGQDIEFKVHSTREAANFYYEVVSRDKVVFTDFSGNNQISFSTTPQMAPSAKLLIYQILPNSEVAADYIPFSVDADYPNNLEASFSKDEASPSEEVDIEISSEGQSKVGIAAVDKSVFILAENRLNLQQVFAELERLYMEPQVELHEASIYSGITARGAMETFGDAGVVVMSNQSVPEGKQYGREMGVGRDGVVMFEGAVPKAENAAPTATPGPQGPSGDTAGLAEVERVRQFFPETWLWQEIVTDPDGKASLDVEVPDTITTWMLHAIGISKENGLGIDEAQLTAFQPFFLKVDLPYSSIRGEEFPVSVAIYNYLDRTQKVRVSIEDAEWFDLKDSEQKWIEVPPSGIGGGGIHYKSPGTGNRQDKAYSPK